MQKLFQVMIMIVRRLKDTREDLDLTQEKIGKILNVDKTTVSGW